MNQWCLNLWRIYTSVCLDYYLCFHDDVIKWKYFPRYWPFVFPSQRAVTRCVDVFFDLCLNKRLRKQSRRRWFETPSLLSATHLSLPFKRCFLCKHLLGNIVSTFNTIINPVCFDKSVQCVNEMLLKVLTKAFIYHTCLWYKTIRFDSLIGLYNQYTLRA